SVIGMIAAAATAPIGCGRPPAQEAEAARVMEEQRPAERAASAPAPAPEPTSTAAPGGQAAPPPPAAEPAAAAPPPSGLLGGFAGDGDLDAEAPEVPVAEESRDYAAKGAPARSGSKAPKQVEAAKPSKPTPSAPAASPVPRGLKLP